LLCTCLHSPSEGADEDSGESWQLVTAIHGEGDGLVLYEGFDCIHFCCVSFCFAGSDRAATFKSVVVEISLHSHRYVCVRDCLTFNAVFSIQQDEGSCFKVFA